MNKKNLFISIAVGIIVSGTTLYYAFRNVPAGELFHYLATINYWWIVPATVIILTSFCLRVYRWQLLLGGDGNIGFWQAFHPLMIGFMLNCVFPGRIGEIGRPLILKKKEDYPFSRALATVAAERVFDSLLLVIMLAAVLSAIPIDPGRDIVFGGYRLNRDTLTAASSGLVKLCMLVVAGVVLVSWGRSRRLVIAAVERLPAVFGFAGGGIRDKVKRYAADPLVHIVENVAAGFSLVKSPRLLLACTLLSVLIWALMALSYYVVSMGAPGVEIGFAQMTAVMVIVCFFIALPSIPGYWGIWEAGGVFALALFGVNAREAAGFTLANHAIQMLPIIVIGLGSALVTGVNLWQVAFKPSRAET